MAEVESEDIKTAVAVRPHHPPCDHPDNPCSCGAFEDRTRTLA